MKKIVLIILMSLSLCACGNKVTSNTCSKNENGMNMAFKMTATNDEIDKIDATIEFDVKSLGLDSLGYKKVSELPDDQKEQFKETMLTSLGIKGDEKGLEVTVDINDNLVVKINMDLKVASKDVLTKLGFDFSNADMSLKNSVKDMKDEGFVCEK